MSKISLPYEICERIMRYNSHPTAEIINSHVSKVKKYIDEYYFYSYDDHSFYVNLRNVKGFFNVN